MGYLRQHAPFVQLVTFLGLMFAFLLLYGVFLKQLFPAISGGYTMEQISDTALWKDASLVKGMKIVQFLYTLVCYLMPAFIFAALAHPRPLQYLGMDRSPRASQLGLALMVILCSLPLVGGLAEWNATWPVSQEMHRLEDLALEQTKLLLQMPDAGALLTNLVLLALLPAIAEETFFRGVLQRLLTQMTRNGWVAAVIAALIFSAIHMQFLGFMPRFLLGFLMGALYFISGNLWLSIAGHFLNNGLQVILVYLYQAKLTSYDVMKDEHAPLYLAVISAVVVFTLLWLLHKTARRNGQTFEQTQND